MLFSQTLTDLPNNVRIRPMVADDLEPTIAAVRDGGWGDRRAALAFYVRHNAAHPFVAESRGAIVGTGIATQNGNVGWVGLIFTAPEWRGRGLGGALTGVVLRHLEGLGCRSMLLAATDLGRPIYDRFGFVTDGGYSVWSGPPRADLPLDPRLRAFTSTDLSRVCGIDQQVTHEDRSHVIGVMLDGWVLAEGPELVGYALRTPWGNGPAIAADPADGRLLFEVLRSQAARHPLSVTVPVENQFAADHLRAVGFVEERRLPRMRLGDPVPWQPQGIWAIFSFAMG
jgi:GNAT superfamily N-acetyltransferase